MRKMYSKKQIEKMIENIPSSVLDEKISALINEYSSDAIGNLQSLVVNMSDLSALFIDNEATAGQVLTADGEGGSEWIDNNDLSMDEITFTEDDFDEDANAYVKEISNIQNAVLYQIIPIPNAIHSTDGKSEYVINSPKIHGLVRTPDSQVDSFSGATSSVNFNLYNAGRGVFIKVIEGLLFEVTDEF